MAIDASDNLYVTTEKFGVLKIRPTGEVVGAFLGFGPLGGIKADATGNLYVLEWGSNTLWKLAPNGAKTQLSTEGIVSVTLDDSGNLFATGPTYGPSGGVYSLKFASVDTYVGPSHDFSKLQKNPDGSFTRTLKDGTRIIFDSSGRQTSFVDTNGNETVYRYDAAGSLLKCKFRHKAKA